MSAATDKEHLMNTTRDTYPRTPEEKAANEERLLFSFADETLNTRLDTFLEELGTKSMTERVEMEDLTDGSYMTLAGQAMDRRFRFIPAADGDERRAIELAVDEILRGLFSPTWSLSITARVVMRFTEEICWVEPVRKTGFDSAASAYIEAMACREELLKTRAITSITLQQVIGANTPEIVWPLRLELSF